MAVTVNNRWIRAVASASQTVFTYDFPITAKENIQIYHIDSSNVVTLLVFSTNYTLTGIGDAGGGTFVLTSGATANDIYVAVGNTPIARTTDFSGKAEITTSAINNQYDDLTKQTQQNNRDITRCLRIPIHDDIETRVTEFAKASDRADKFMYFDANGDVTTSAGTGPITGTAGPASATDGAIALWDGTSGALLKDSTFVFDTADGPANNVIITNGSKTLSFAHNNITALSTSTITNDSSIDFTLNTGFGAYVFLLSNIVPATTGTDLYLRTSTDGGSTYDSGASDYGWSNKSLACVGTPTPLDQGDDADTKLKLNGSAIKNTGGIGISGMVYIINQDVANHTYIIWQTISLNDSGTKHENNSGGGVRLASEDVNAVRFLMSSGNLSSGSISVYPMLG